ncbi:MAG: LicD family protein [Prevotella sp.]|nr:LicD family protein [Prevotella sp.]
MDFKEAYKKKLLEVYDFTVKFLDDHNLQWWAAYGTGIGAVRHQGLIPWDDDIDLHMLRKDYDKLFMMRDELRSYGYDLLSAHDGSNSVFFLKICSQRTTLVERREEPIDIGVFVDIFPLDYVGDDLQEFESNYNSYRRWQLLHEYTYLKVSLIDVIKAVKQRSGNATRYLYSILAPKFIQQYTRKKAMSWEKKISGIEKGKYLATYYNTYTGNRYLLDSKWFEGYETLKFEGRPTRLPLQYDDYLRLIYGDYMTPPKEIPDSTHWRYYVNLNEKIGMDEVRMRVKKGIVKEF